MMQRIVHIEKKLRMLKTLKHRRLQLPHVFEFFRQA